jgi:HAE1 family hydrophobic/amphiphilic exporter-1
MIGVTFFGLLFTPAFYVIVRKLASWTERQRAKLSRKKPEAPEAEATA